MEFDVDKTIAYWMEGARYDLDTADAMFETARYPYSLFMGHLALEKLLKALVVKRTKTQAPITHSLPFLSSKLEKELPQEIKIRLREFMEFHIEARYPDSNRTFYTKCTKEYTKARLDEIKKVFQWLQKNI